jgi:hypothetical protein
MKWYYQEHPLEKQEDVERSSGIEALRKKHEKKMRERLLNVFVDGDERFGNLRRDGYSEESRCKCTVMACRVLIEGQGRNHKE